MASRADLSDWRVPSNSKLMYGNEGEIHFLPAADLRCFLRQTSRPSSNSCIVVPLESTKIIVIPASKPKRSVCLRQRVAPKFQSEGGKGDRPSCSTSLLRDSSSKNNWTNPKEGTQRY